MLPERLRAMADVLAALTNAQALAESPEYQHLLDAERNVFYAIRELVDGQIGPLFEDLA